MLKMWKRVLIVILALLLISDVLFIFHPEPNTVEAAEIPSIPEISVDPNGSPNTFYFVAMFYYDTWRYNDGSWYPAAPGSDVAGVTFPYAFDMPGRKIKSVTVRAFNKSFVDQNRTKWTEVFHLSRYKQYQWRTYEDQTSRQHGAQIINLQGIGTSSVSFDLRLTSPSLLNAPDPQPPPLEEGEEESGNPGERHYFPMLLTIEVEPQLIVKHFTTTGTSLGHIFTDTVEEMRNGTRYQKIPPTHPDYNYVGYKKSTTGNAPTGEIIPGMPPAFTYDNTFNTYTLFLYYSHKDDTSGGITGDFTINPNPVNHGQSFRFIPQSIQNNTGKNISRIQWRIHNPITPTQYQSYEVTGTNSRDVTAAQYPSWMPNTTRSYEVHMYVQLQGESEWIRLNQKTLQIRSTGGGIPGQPEITARFVVEPDTIEFRESFTLRPIEIDTKTCTYTSHRYRIEGPDRTSQTPLVSSKTQNSTFTYSTYPSAISTGTHTIYIKVFTSDCGETDWISPQTLTVTEPSGNSPPEFQVAWVDPNTWEPVNTVIEGRRLHLVLIEDPEPYDPDGDPIYWEGFDTASSSSQFVRDIPSKYDEYDIGYFNITMDTLGTHRVEASMRDRWGARTVRSAAVNVIPPNPVPIISGPSEVVEGRPLPEPFSSERSYSPVGRAIDHSRDEWKNVREVYDTPGEEIIELHVYDSIGMKSVNPARHTLKVKEDLPPIPQLEYLEVGVRNQSITITNKSYSPDGDEIVKTRIRYRYDSNNDGNFNGESWTTATLNKQGQFSIRSTKVGRYQIEVYVEEDWGKNATEYYDLEIVNDAPFVQFHMTSDVIEPFAPKFENISPSSYSNWTPVNVYSNSLPNGWNIQSNTLIAPEFSVSPYRFSSKNLKLIGHKVSGRGSRRYNHFEYLEHEIYGQVLIGNNYYDAWCGSSRCSYTNAFDYQLVDDTWKSLYESSWGKSRIIFIDRKNGLIHYEHTDSQYRRVTTITDFLSTDYRIPENYIEEYHRDENREKPYHIYDDPANFIFNSGGLRSNQDVLYTNDGNQITVQSGPWEIYYTIEDAQGKRVRYDLDEKYESATNYTNRPRIRRVHLVDHGKMLVWTMIEQERHDGERSSDRSYTYLFSSDVDMNQIPQTMSMLYRSNSPNYSDFELIYQIQFEHFIKELNAGYAFGVTDRRNMYRVEADGETVKLVKITNGQKNIIASQKLTFQEDEFYEFKIRVLNQTIQVYVNHIPVLTASNQVVPSGKISPYTEINKVAFKGMKIADLSDLGKLYSAENVALVGSPIDYSLHIQDPENDPIIAQKNEWTYRHVNPNKFLNAGDGKSGQSAYHNKTYQTPVIHLDRVGEYRISFRTEDDPAPSSNYRYPAKQFENYRKSSNTFEQTLIVHRKPIARFTISAQSNGTIQWNDTSYDPDRWLSSSNYSTENTGINYRTTRGILERKYYYIDPSGNSVDRQLLYPTEKGMYTVGLAVRDEYGAWSDWEVKTINVANVPTPDEPPKAGFTVNPTSTYRGVNVTINSTASDKEDGGRENLRHQYYIRNLTEGTIETLQSESRTSWTKSFNTLGEFNIRQIVWDSKNQTDQFNRQVTIVNRLPSTTVTTPSSSNQNNPIKFDVLRPEFRWNYSDADGDPQSRFQVRIYRYGGTIVMESGTIQSSAKEWVPDADLPEHVNMYIQVRTHDGYDWGNWSAARYFYIETNQPPTADFDWTPKPVWEGDIIHIQQMIDDPDGDILSVNYQVKKPDTSIQTFTKSVSPPYTSAGPTFQAEMPGQYFITLTVHDFKAPPVIVSKTITVQPLAVYGAVKHTDLWEQYRQEHNDRFPNDFRSADTFWAGEVFILEANVTNTGSSETQVDKVEVMLLSENVQVSLGKTASFKWEGEMWEESFEQLPAGELTFRFRATWNNGVVKEDIVTVMIRDSIWSTIGVHRRR